MDWATIITSILALSVEEGLFRIIDKIRFKREDKKEKKESVEQTAVATDHQQIDLGDLFLEKTQKWSQIIEDSAKRVVEANNKRDEDWSNLKSDIVTLKSDMYTVKSDVSDIKNEQRMEIMFLNGDYAAFKESMAAQTTKL